jgi:hypothetical protein
MEFLYPLNLDPAEKVIKSFENLSKSIKSSGVFYPSVNETLNDSYINYLGFNWRKSNIHVKSSGQIGRIHRDNWKDKNLMLWAVNWVWGSDGIMDYWSDDQIQEVGLKKDISGGYRIDARPLEKPKKSYRTSTGVYLVDISKFHRVSNIGKSTRYAVSLSCNPLYLRTWEDVVDHFKNKLKVLID